MDSTAMLKMRACFFIDDTADFSDAEIADLWHACAAYLSGDEFEFKERGAEVAFRNFKRVFDSDAQYAYQVSDKRAEAGRLGGKSRTIRSKKANASKGAKNDVKSGAELGGEANASNFENPLFDGEGADFDGAENADGQANEANASKGAKNARNLKGRQAKQALNNKIYKNNKKIKTPPPKPAPASRGNSALREREGDAVGGFAAPTAEEWKAFCNSLGWKVAGEIADAWRYYDVNGWKTASGNPVLNWKSAALRSMTKANKDAGRLYESAAEDLLDADTPPREWRTEFAQIKRIATYDIDETLTWHVLATTDRQTAVAVMKECLKYPENRKLFFNSKK